MIYLRQKYKEKPQAWGPVESVQRSLAINAERIGINYEDIALAMPMWEKAGTIAHCFAGKTKIVAAVMDTGVSWHSQGCTFPQAQILGIKLPINSITMPQSTQYTILANGYYTDSYGGTASYRSIVGIGGAGYSNRLILGFMHLGVGGTYQPKIGIYDAQTAKKTTGSTDVVNTKYSAAYRYDGINNNLFLNGQPESFTGTSIGGLSFVPTTISIGVCRYGNDGYTSYHYVQDSPAQIYSVSMFTIALSDSQITSLSDNPYQLWQRQGDVYFSIPVSGGGTTYSEFISWKIKTLNEKQILWNILNNNTYNTSWKLFNTQETEISNKILTKDIVESAYSILSQSNKQTSWHIKSELNKETSWSILLSSVFSQDIKWKILNSNSKIITYNILNKISKELSNKIFNIKETETSWQILVSNLLSQDIEWKILNKSEKEIIWKVLNTILNNSSWKLLSSSEKEIAWQITLTNFFTSDMSWKIFNTEYTETIFNILKNSNSITSWIIFNSEEINTKWNLLKTQDKISSYKILNQTSDDISWKIFNIHDHNLSWNIKKISLLNNEWKIFNTEDLITRWSIVSGIIPSSILDIIQESKNFSNGSKVFTQEPREFIFIQNKKTIIIL